MSRPVTHRLFYAILPPAKERQQLVLMRDGQEGAESIVADERLHITLAVTREYPALPKGLADAMAATGAALRADPIDIWLDQLSGSNRSVVLRPAKSCPALRLLNNRLEARSAAWALRSTAPSVRTSPCSTAPAARSCARSSRSTGGRESSC